MRLARFVLRLATRRGTIAGLTVVGALVVGQMMLRASTSPTSTSARVADALGAVRRRLPIWRLRAQDLAAGAAGQAREKIGALV